MLNQLWRLSLICALYVLLFVAPLQAETIEIPGTGDGTAVLHALTAAYTIKHPETQFEIPQSVGSSGGIKAAGSGQAMLARVARTIQQKEERYNLKYLPYARVPAVFFVTDDVPVEYLSSQQICDIYRGEITNWQQLGGSDSQIQVFRREESDSTMTELRKSFPGFAKLTITDNAEIATKAPELLSRMQHQKSAIGFGPYDVAKNSGMKIIKVDGRDPMFAGYPSLTTLAFVYREERLSENARRFLEFALSAEANLPILAAGGVPTN